jgi:hypothetical protein
MTNWVIKKFKVSIMRERERERERETPLALKGYTPGLFFPKNLKYAEIGCFLPQYLSYL